jgi:hypothetical protein
MAKFVDIGRESYVGQRVFPRLALLYASSMVYREQAHYEFVRDYIQEYVEDVYFDSMRHAVTTACRCRSRRTLRVGRFLRFYAGQRC